MASNVCFVMVRPGRYRDTGSSRRRDGAIGLEQSWDNTKVLTIPVCPWGPLGPWNTRRCQRPHALYKTGTVNNKYSF